MSLGRYTGTLATAVILWAGSFGQAGELAGAVNVRSGIVHVEVEDDGKPAVGVKVRLQEARKKEIIAEGKINAEGQWSWPLLKAGSYEVVIEQAGKEPLVWPVDQREQVEPTGEDDTKKCPHHEPTEGPPNLIWPLPSFPWLLVGLGSAFVGSCGLVVWFSRWKRR